MWNHHLHVALGPQSSRFKKRFAVINASSIHVYTSIDIVESVGHAVKLAEEFVVKEVFGFGPDAVLKGGDVDVWIHDLNSSGRRARFSLSHIRRAEKELSVQVGLFDAIHVSHIDVSAFSGTDSEHGKVFEKLTAYGSSTNHEVSEATQVFLEIGAEYCNLGIETLEN